MSKKKVCVWTGDHRNYETECGESFYFDPDGDDLCAADSFKFCPYCGKTIKTKDEK